MEIKKYLLLVDVLDVLHFIIRKKNNISVFDLPFGGYEGKNILFPFLTDLVVHQKNKQTKNVLKLSKYNLEKIK